MEAKVHPCFSAWCSKCHKPCMLTRGMEYFRTPSEFYTHQWVFWKSMVDDSFLTDE